MRETSAERSWSVFSGHRSKTPAATSAALPYFRKTVKVHRFSGEPRLSRTQCNREGFASASYENPLRKIMRATRGGFTKIRGRACCVRAGTVLTDSVIHRRSDLQILYRLRVEMAARPPPRPVATSCDPPGSECVLPRIRCEKREGRNSLRPRPCRCPSAPRSVATSCDPPVLGCDPPVVTGWHVFCS